MAMRSTHNNFSLGELDPTLFARADVDIYTKGARKLRNMISLWTGAATLAPGTEHVDIIVDRTDGDTPITNISQVKITKFEYDSDNDIIYTIIIRPDTTDVVAIDIYYQNVLQATVPAPFYTLDQISGINFANGQDRVLFLHEEVQPYKLKRGSDHTTWTFDAQTISTKPVFDFTVIGSATNYRTPSFLFTLSDGTVGVNRTLNANSPIFNYNFIGGLFISNGGISRIVSITSSTVAKVDITSAFNPIASLKGKDSSLTEVMWTSGETGADPLLTGPDRGWPARGLFYVDRLYLGRTSTLKNIVAGSTLGVYDNFDDSDADDTSGFSFSLTAKGNQTLQDIVGEDALMFLGGSRLFATNPLTEAPVTPSSFFAPPQAPDGASEIPAVTIDNQVLHVQKGYKQVLRLGYDTQQAKFLASPATELSSHLIETITSNAAWLPNNITAKLYMVTQENGSLLYFNTLIEQGVAAWSYRDTRGKFMRVSGLSNESHLIVERQVNIGNNYDTGIDYGFISDSTFKAYCNVTGSLNGTFATIFENNNDYVVVGSRDYFTGLNVNLQVIAGLDVLPTFEYLDEDGAWQFFAPLDTTNGFTVDGSITWTPADVSAWALANLNGVPSQYWIRMRRNEASVITAPIESLIVTTDNTDFDTAYTTDSGFTVFTDTTNFFRNTNVPLFTDVNDYLLLGNDIPFTQMDLTFETVSSDDLLLTFEYLDGNGDWNAFTPTDNTSGFTVAGDITWTFDDVSGWMPDTANKIDLKYWIRIRRTEETVTTLPVEHVLRVNTSARLFVEEMTFDKYMDNTTNTRSDSNGDITGLDNLAGQQVYAISNGATFGPYFVESDGTTNVTEQYSSVDLGLQYKPLLRPMPIFAPTQEGDNIYKERYVKSLYIDFVDSLYVQASGKNIPTISLGEYTLGEPMPPQTDIFQITPMGGWEPRQNIDITQAVPGPMTIIGVGYITEIT